MQAYYRSGLVFNQSKDTFTVFTASSCWLTWFLRLMKARKEVLSEANYCAITNDSRWFVLLLTAASSTATSVVDLSHWIWTPLKLVRPRNGFFRNIWAHSEKFVTTTGQLPEGKSVTTKNISGVHSGMSRKVNDCFSWISLSGPTAFEMCDCHKLCTVYDETELVCSREWNYTTLCVAEQMGLSSFQKPQKLPPYTTGPDFASEIRFRVYIIQSFGKWSKFFRESPYSALKKFQGGTNFGGSIFTMTNLLGWSGNGSWSLVDGWVFTCNPVWGNWISTVDWISMSASKIWIMYWDKVMRGMARLILVM